MRNLGGAIGLAAINTVLNDRMALHWTRLVENMPAGDPTAQAFLDHARAGMTGAMGSIAENAAIKMLANTVYRQAEVLTMADAQYLMSAIFIAGLLLVPVLRRPRGAPVAADH
jgi:DHA2 family multidrug resistance protein